MNYDETFFHTGNFPNQEHVLMNEFENPMLLEISRDDRMILRHFATKVKNFGLAIAQNNEGKVSEIFFIAIFRSGFISIVIFNLVQSSI